MTALTLYIILYILLHIFLLFMYDIIYYLFFTLLVCDITRKRVCIELFVIMDILIF
jgi:hypothetical protein